MEFVRELIEYPLEYLQCLEFSGTYSNQLLKVSDHDNEISYAFERVWKQMWTGVRLGTAEGVGL